MEPPMKRRRLSLFHSDEPDAELERSRRQNDLLLKSRFEAIFQKYSQDFTSTGDEIDLQTGRVIVDNGHLTSMSDERDTGMSASPAPGTAVADGRSMLRAMTAAPDRRDPYFTNSRGNDVIDSIETIAGNAAVSDDEESDQEEEEDSEDDLAEDSAEEESDEQDVESEDELFNRPAREVWRDFSLRPESNENSSFLSDQDSLFDVAESRRASTPDSLFEDAAFESSDSQAKHSGPATGEQINELSLNENSDERAIRDRFGSQMGQQVIDFLQQRKKAELHINPAWRIPIQIPDRSSVASTVSDDMDPNYAPDQSLYDEIRNQKRSIWAPIVARPARRSARQKDIERREREESEDPLQDGFNTKEGEQADDINGDEDEETRLSKFDRQLTRGLCPFCKLQCVNRTTALGHLSRLSKKFAEGRESDGFHTYENIEQLRTYVMRQAKENRGPRFFVCDFRTMVELHEGAGLSFADIRSSGTLKTRGKDAMALRNHYLQWRRLESEMDEVKSREGWTRRDDKLLLKLAAEPMTTMVTIHRHFDNLHDVDVGNRLAFLFLEQLRRTDDDVSSVGADNEDEDADHEEDMDRPQHQETQPDHQFMRELDQEAPLEGSGFHEDYYCEELPFVEESKDQAGGTDDPLFVPRIW